MKCARLIHVLLSLLAFLGSTGCARPDVAWQNSTIDALLDGNYDGEATFAELRKHGDFGLGTFDALDGEMLALDGSFYRVRADGSVVNVPARQRTPFAVMTFFRKEKTCELRGPMTYAQLQEVLDGMRYVMHEHGGHAFAMKIRGAFDTVRTRSVPRQRKPYPPLAEVVKTQPTFDLKNVRGTLVGFWFPESMRHVNVPGYHFHFITEDGSAGGHVLELSIRSGVVAAQELSEVRIALPRRPPATRPTTNLARELNAVEQ